MSRPQRTINTPAVILGILMVGCWLWVGYLLVIPPHGCSSDSAGVPLADVCRLERADRLRYAVLALLISNVLLTLLAFGPRLLRTLDEWTTPQRETGDD